MANGNVNVSVKTSDLAKMIEGLIEKEKKRHAERVEKFKDETVSYNNAFAQWRDKAADTLIKQAEQIRRGTNRNLSFRHYSGSGAHVELHLQLPTQPVEPQTPRGPSIEGMQRDVRLLKMSSEDTIRITANSNFSRYF